MGVTCFYLFQGDSFQFIFNGNFFQFCAPATVTMCKADDRQVLVKVTSVCAQTLVLLHKQVEVHDFIMLFSVKRNESPI